MSYLRFVFPVIVCTLLFLSPTLMAQESGSIDPLGIILTWQQDPATTMTIDWHTPNEDRNAELRYRLIGETDWQTLTGKTIPYPHSDRLIHRAELTGLQPDSGYEFQTGSYTRLRKFKTMPQTTSRPVRFAAGGDVRHRMDWMDQMNRQAARFSPDFIVWGGDLAYGDGRSDRMYRWYEFMHSVMNTLVTPDGFTIPVIGGIGNHEVLGSYVNNNTHELRREMPPYAQNDESRARMAPNYYVLIAFPGQPGYGVLDFGNYLSIILLDTDHTNPVEGVQTEWLAKTLAERSHIPHIIPTYHVPAYPSVRTPDGATQKKVRDHWVPLFEKNNLRLVFENHDHAYKRTYPIRNGKIDPTGVVYIGDGAWGVNHREIGRDQTDHAWYLKRVASSRHAIIVTVHGSLQHTMVVSDEGKIIDEYPRTPYFDLPPFDLTKTWDKGHD